MQFGDMVLSRTGAYIRPAQRSDNLARLYLYKVYYEVLFLHLPDQLSTKFSLVPFSFSQLILFSNVFKLQYELLELGHAVHVGSCCSSQVLTYFSFFSLKF